MSIKSRSALLLYVLTSVILLHTCGHYLPVFLVLLATASAGLIWILFWHVSEASEVVRNHSASLPIAITTALVFLSYLLWNRIPLEFAQAGSLLSIVKLMHACVLGCALMMWILEYLQLNFERTARTFAGCALLLLAFDRFLVPMVSPVVPIDVLVWNNLACDHLTAWHNPYSQEYPDIDGGNMGYRPFCPYGPATYVCLTPFRYLWGDVRYANATADCLTAVFLIALARQVRLPVRVSLYLGLAWLANPIGLYVLERAWIDSLLTCGVVAAALFLLRQQWLALGIALGFVASAKQYGFAVPVFVILWLMRHDYPWKRVAAITAATSLAFVAPFVLADPRAFYRNTVEQFFLLGIRRDALALQAMYAHWAGQPCPQWIPQFITLAGFALSARWVRWGQDRRPTAWLAGLIAFFTLFFLLGKQAFCNYYHFVSSIVLTYLVLSLSARFHSQPRNDSVDCRLDVADGDSDLQPCEQQTVETALA